MKLSIVICTYQRAELLRHCLVALSKQSISSKFFEVIVVDNNSKDNTAEVAKEFESKFENFRYILEKEQGLSHARNRGYKECKTAWVGYVDDDAKARPNYVERAMWFIDKYNYGCFSGVYLPWYKYGKPYWYKDKYGSNKKKYEEVTVLTGSESICGGTMFIKKELLEKHKGFSTNLGMSGGVIAYGEEVDFQMKLQKDNVECVYDPELIIEHVVAPYKLNLGWFFASYFAAGRDGVIMGIFKSSFPGLLLTFLVTLIFTFLRFLYFTPRLLRKDYYVQNWLLDVFRKTSKRIGAIYFALLEKSTKKYGKEDVEPLA